MYKLGQRSLQNLSGVHPDLVAVVKRAIEITEQDFSVIEGVRNIDRQRQLVKSGASQTMNSRHLTGHAVDIAPYPLSTEMLIKMVRLTFKTGTSIILSKRP